MAYREDEEKRIYELETAESLSAGTFVPVDKEGNEMAEKFDLGTALNKKVDAPSTAPEAGQVLTFDGSENTWANPPEGVYVLNYSEVTDYSDIDINRATTQPTYIKVDSDQTITIRPNYTNQFTVNIANGTLLRLIEIKSNAWATFTTEQVGSYPGTPNNSGFGANCHLDLMLKICRSEVSETTKVWAASGDIEDGRNLFLGVEPKPCTFYYSNGRGTDITSGSFEKYTGRSTSVQITDAAGNYRRNLLMPAEIQDHDFSSDTTPEQIQFMGWGATSNRAGYQNLITAQHTYDSTNFPIQTPQVQFLKFKMSGGTPESDQVMDVVQATMKSTDGQSTTVIGGILVPAMPRTPGALQYWSDSNGRYYGWKPVNEVPASTAQDEGKVLTVDSNGAPVWDINFPVKNGYAIGSSESTVTIPNNASSTLSSSAESTLTLNVNVGPFEVPNFVVEISASSNITLTVTKTVNNTTTTLKYSVAAGNTIEAGKYYQVTAVGNCWTLAEFANPS